MLDFVSSFTSLISIQLSFRYDAQTSYIRGTRCSFISDHELEAWKDFKWHHCYIMKLSLEIILRGTTSLLTVVALFGCYKFLYRSRVLKKTNFVRYCIALAFSDSCLAFCFLSNFSGFSKYLNSNYFHQTWVIQCATKPQKATNMNHFLDFFLKHQKTRFFDHI